MVCLGAKPFRPHPPLTAPSLEEAMSMELLSLLLTTPRPLTKGLRNCAHREGLILTQKLVEIHGRISVLKD
jgi:hypothetical protein